MMKIINSKTLALITIALAVLSLPSVLAVLDLEVNTQDSYAYGDTILIDYTIKSNFQEPVSVLYRVYYDCPTAPIPIREIIHVQLDPGSSVNDLFFGNVIDSSIDSQTCTAVLEILSPSNTIKEKSFDIISQESTTPSFDFGLITCNNEACTESKKVFMPNENIYISYDSEVANPTVTTVLTSPDKTKKQIALPYTIQAPQTQIGTYELDVTASKTGYSSTSLKELFSVIESDVEILSASVCNADGICTDKENIQNCPQDCKAKALIAAEPETEKPIGRDMIIVIAIIIVAVIVIVVAFLKKLNN